jgi:hypothetical protein
MARTVSAAIGLLLTLSATAVPQTSPSLDEVLARLGDYMRAYAQDYAATIAAEHYSQSAGRRTTVLDSEFGIVRLPGNGLLWLGLRDVVRVDGKQVPDRESRLAGVFASASTTKGFSSSVATLASGIVTETARFNIGTVQRTINNPALVLELLDPRHYPDFRFSKAGEGSVAGIRAWRVAFVERGRPTVMSTTSDGDLPATGEIWVDPSFGRLLRADVAIQFTALGGGGGRIIKGLVSLTFKYAPEVELWVPDKMMERYDEAFGRPLQNGEATYTNYRRFRVESDESIK